MMKLIQKKLDNFNNILDSYDFDYIIRRQFIIEPIREIKYELKMRTDKEMKWMFNPGVFTFHTPISWNDK